jgi:hypothetical protein
MATSLFNLQMSGSLNVGAVAWVDLGVVPVGYKIWIGSDQFVTNYKICSFQLRGNATGQSAATLAATTALYSAWTSSNKVKSVTQDLYQRGKLHIATVVGAGTERLWLYVTSKTATLQPVSYLLNYVLE